MNDKYTYIIGKASGSGGGEGTSDYNKLSNKPSINGQVLQGDITIETGGIKTIEVDNIYIPETDFWPNYRIHQDVLIPLLQSGEEFQIKEHFKNEWEEGYRYYRLPAYRKLNVEKGGFIDADFFQYPTITYNGGYVSSIRYYGEPDGEGYYTAYKQDNHIVPEPWRIDIGDGSQYFDNSQELYALLRNLKQDFNQKLEGTITREIFLYEKVSETNDVMRYYHTYVKTDNDRWPWDIPEGEESTIVLFAQGTDVNGNLITLKLTAHKLEDGTYENTKTYINSVDQINNKLETI